ncbi:MAG: hypothetical protein PHX51_03165 [Clostridia bacterium]|nr:hypothetical protein [Clostridia bacterium]
MKNKVFIGLVAVALLVFTLFAGVNAPGVSASEITGSYIFAKTSGIVTVGSPSANGLAVTLGASTTADATTSNSFYYKQTVLTGKFGFSSIFGVNFETLKMVITDTDDSANYVTIELDLVSVDDGYVLNGSTTIKGKDTEYISDNIPVTVSDDGVQIDFAIQNGEGGYELTVNGQSLNITEAISFKKSTASLAFTVSGTNSSSTEVVVFKSLTNANGTQELTDEAALISPIVRLDSGLEAIAQEDEITTDENEVTTTTKVFKVQRVQYDAGDNKVYSNAIAAVDKYYTFPILANSLIGDYFKSLVSETKFRLNLSIYSGEADENGNLVTDDEGNPVWTAVSSSVSGSFLMEKDFYKFEFLVNASQYSDITDNIKYVLYVNVIKDEFAPLFNDDKVFDYFYSNIGNLERKTEDDDVGLFPSMEEDDEYMSDLFKFGAAYVYSSTEKDDEWDGIDDIDTITVYLGYMSPTSSTWTYVKSSNTVSVKTEGSWRFTYKVVDASGNETVYKDGKEYFTVYVVDNTAPSISVTENIDITVNKDYTISTPTVSDDGVGVNSARTTIKLFKGIKGSEDVVEIPLTVSYMIPTEYIPTEITPNGTAYTFYVEYTAYDFNGNKTTEYSYLSVIAAKEEDPTTDDNKIDWLFISLIAVAAVLVVVIILMLFSKPKEEVADNKKYKAKK